MLAATCASATVASATATARRTDAGARTDRGQVRRAARGTADNRRWPAGVDAATGVGAQVLEEVDRHRRSAWLLVGRVTGIGDDGECRVRELGCGLASLFDGRVRFEVAGLHEDRDVGHRGARQW